MNAILDWEHLRLANPYFLALLLLIPLFIFREFRKGKSKAPSLLLSTSQGLSIGRVGFKARYRRLMFALRLLSIAFISIALARPQSTNTTTNADTEGIDIVLSMDISGSMLAEDFTPNRMEAAKRVALDFVDKRPGDRIGLVIFAGESFTMCPITIDHNVLKQQIETARSGLIADGTSIGMGLATAVDRLRYSKAKSRVIILMTDGVNNTGAIGPLDALELAKVYKLKVYTIGVGTMGNAVMPMQTPMGTVRQTVPVEIDEPLMKKIAAETGGRYFRATNNKSLQNIYGEIDKLEKSKIEVTSYKHYADLYFPFAAAAILFLLAELVLRYTIFRTVT